MIYFFCLINRHNSIGWWCFQFFESVCAILAKCGPGDIFGCANYHRNSFQHLARCLYVCLSVCEQIFVSSIASKPWKTQSWNWRGVRSWDQNEGRVRRLVRSEPPHTSHPPLLFICLPFRGFTRQENGTTQRGYEVRQRATGQTRTLGCCRLCMRGASSTDRAAEEPQTHLF